MATKSRRCSTRNSERDYSVTNQNSERTDPTRDDQYAAIARFLHLVTNLKRTKRTGWLDRGLDPAEAESIADHSYRVALLAWLIASLDGDGPRVDPNRVLLVALAHDLPEALAGDLPPYDAEILPGEAGHPERHAFLNRRQTRSADRQAAKRAAEAAALDELLAGLPADLAAQLRGAWEEYEARETPEAKLVRQADKLETYLQSREYLAEDPSRPMASFATEVADPATLTDGRLIALRDAIVALFADQPDPRP